MKLGPSSLDLKGDILINTNVIYGVLLGLIILLVVEPTPLKNMHVKKGSSSPIFGVKIKIFELPPPSYPFLP